MVRLTSLSNALPKTQADLIQLFEPVRADLEAVEREYERQVQSQVHVIPEIGAYIQKSGGKRVRPAVLLMAARLMAGASAAVFGFAHFNYIDFTAGMVPGWIPFKTFWAWATGAGHLATGLALISGFKARLAAGCEAAMMGSFVVLLHLPRVIAAPDQHVEWIMLAVSSMLTGSALLVRKYATIEA